LELDYTPTYYDDYAEILDGDVKSARTRLFYALDSSKYMILKASYEYEDTKNKTYTNDRIGYGIGFGAELPWGFRAYVEPSIQYTHYKGARWTVQDYRFVQIKERDTLRKYTVSLSNNKISAWGFVPTLSYTYTDKSSNIRQREYDKSVIELSISKGF
jgi:outer membrane protein assembly factor BamA